eukprot:6522008-Pyramimonas_sp.AAC.1
MAVNDCCVHCGMRGTLHHRVYDCPRGAVPRREECPTHVMQAAMYVRSLGEEAAEMMARCLFPSPSFCLPVTE